MSTIISCIKTVGRGERGRQSLSFEQAYQVMTEYLAGDIDDDQMAMLMMLIRVNNETPQEIAGFVKAFQQQVTPLDAEIDWPCYAGKRPQAGEPWHVLAAKILADNGHKVLLHGYHNPQSDRIHAENVLVKLGIAQAHTLCDAQRLLDKYHIAYLPLEVFAPQAKTMLGWQQRYGLRTPINTVVRALNPARALTGVRGSFHPGFQQLHAEVEHWVGQTQHAVVSFKGQSGESEYNPKVSQTVWVSQDSGVTSHYWQELQLDDLPVPGRCPLDTAPSVIQQMANTVIETMSVALFAQLQDRTAARAKALSYWQTYCDDREIHVRPHAPLHPSRRSHLCASAFRH
ncbi:glycosyl transferase family protein [Vibrio sp. SM6]|uniref:Glycosyl transferase family protein n=1 Tax=Vibrio agarilyticus TaxID=2726741 RepID=A0A7X8TTW7_9VIBR|nr:glycosyl transferase family protein [Vibrio agarilyticus]NLS14718.1 glycosyl transferase family protein [Vibrio agarilyticus]